MYHLTKPGFNTVSSLASVRLLLLYFTSQHRVLLYFTAQLRVQLYFTAHLRLCSDSPHISASALHDDSSGAWLPLRAPHPGVLQTGPLAHFPHDEALEGPGAGPSSGPQGAGQVRLCPGRALLGLHLLRADPGGLQLVRGQRHGLSPSHLGGGAQCKNCLSVFSRILTHFSIA